ncbi:hypothetical protein C1645_812107 [Glomus cerebriforme]|uniref:Uncharacterized protein n=1 Tax=Glomus cerebriforme TaxID=658196 RepID=A0A397TPT8_9GLOM|nr:hypothetical protein C1645_812107 [Glomus cerebriforme]
MDIRLLEHQIFYSSEAKTRLKTICELNMSKYTEILIFMKKFNKKGEYSHSFLPKLLPELHKLKTLKIHGDRSGQLKKIPIYRDLEKLNIDFVNINTINCIIENSGGYLKEILLRFTFYDNFIDDSLILIRKIYEKCPFIDSLSLLLLLSEEHIIEFENLLKVCQNLKSILFFIINNMIGKKVEELLKTFLEEWRGRPTLSILTYNSAYGETQLCKSQ